ncbi:hypothetical protein AWW67_02210 [Roseivirga seohaensis]|uniref:HTH cro/C1-type domain-containing protein n=1 Tax=Roseivirga seohaensis TaxID=1914963 RepID=A0A150XYZ3_9BACT|nr:helix-turn-helix transcriptional regulator [Roseivirga seohaensis]KYG83953.1 hypothetical protein AWW67_02210 [Roseivirga seohaensis]
MSDFLKKIKEIRLTKGLNQSEFANMIGMNQSNYGKIERGEYQLSVNKLIEIAEKLEVPAFSILFDDEDDKRIFDKETELTIEALEKKIEILEMSNEQLLKILALNGQQEKQSDIIVNQLRTLLKYQAANNKRLKEFISNWLDKLSEAGEDQLHKLYPGLTNEQLDSHIETLRQHFGLDVDDSIESDLWDDLLGKMENAAELTEKLIRQSKDL